MVVWIVVIVVTILAYQYPKVSGWRNYNNGMRDYKDNNFQNAAVSFSKAYNIYGHPNLKFNECISGWSAIMKRKSDLKIDTIADSTLPETDRKFLLNASQETRNKIARLLSNPSLKSKQLATLHFALGMLFLFENHPDEARVAFQQSIKQQADFTPALKQLVKAKISDENSVTTQLLLNEAKNESIGLLTWKPF